MRHIKLIPDTNNELTRQKYERPIFILRHHNDAQRLIKLKDIIIAHSQANLQAILHHTEVCNTSLIAA